MKVHAQRERVQRRNPTNLHHSWHNAILLAVAVSLIAAAQAGRAQTVAFDNLGSAPYDQDGYATFGLYSDGNQYERGMQFTTSQTVSLSTVQLAIGQAYFPGVQSGTASVQLMTDSNNAPGTVLESWTSGSLSGGPGGASVQTFTSVRTPTLTAGVNYWIVLSDATDSDLGGAWCFAESSAPSYVLTMWANETTGSTTFETLTRGFQTLITGTQTPSLSISLTRTNTVIVSWPASAVGWVLESTNSIAPASAPWPQVPPPYSSTATNFFMTFTNNPAAGNKFFRLFNP